MSRLHPTFHVSILKRWKGALPNTPGPVFYDDVEEPHYEVERVLRRRTRRGREEFLVVWAGYPLHEASWQPRDNLSEDCIRVFE